MGTMYKILLLMVLSLTGCSTEVVSPQPTKEKVVMMVMPELTAPVVEPMKVDTVREPIRPRPH
ncbi:MAG: hypothetical protein EAZ91_13985 [Cytophagales bacterium]|nr:MAG: hypothetical protein EAZ91_13985 [Cytophagales bacterium]